MEKVFSVSINATRLFADRADHTVHSQTHAREKPHDVWGQCLDGSHQSSLPSTDAPAAVNQGTESSFFHFSHVRRDASSILSSAVLIDYFCSCQWLAFQLAPLFSVRCLCYCLLVAAPVTVSSPAASMDLFAFTSVSISRPLGRAHREVFAISCRRHHMPAPQVFAG